ncbi:MAG TPA: peptide-methionine (S)-S-oxide reductase MsrA [Candidatus Paceibacterota bacterium]
MTKKIVLGGGCFWGLQDLIRKQQGVVKTTVGYSDGAEVVEIEYDTDATSYEKMLDFFFQIHNPTTVNRQGNDIGTAYRSVIFYNDDEEKKEAEKFIEIVNKSGLWTVPVVTTLEPFVRFTKAEEYHQDYLQKNPGGYTCHKQFSQGCNILAGE